MNSDLIRDNSRHRVYFGASDNQMEPFQTMEDFKKVFVHNVLLMGDVAIPDIFLYISNFMVNQLDNHPSFSKFMAHSVGTGAIIPYFRSNCEGSFVENLRQIREMGIVGLHDKADEVAKFFENSARGKVLRYQLWPDAPLSIGYKQLLESSLLTMSTSSRSAALEVFREETRDLREELFEEIPPDDRGGIRRGDIFLAASKIAQRHGEPIAAFNDVWNKIADADLSRKLRRILKWASYCYYYNQGKLFDVKPGLSRLDELDIEFARLLDHQDHGEAEPHAIVEQVRFPSIDGLLTVDPEHLFGVRNSAKGDEYFKSISEWQTNPSMDNAEEMSQRLKEYANAITDVYTRRGTHILNADWSLLIAIPTQPGTFRAFGAEAVKVAISKIAGMIVGTGASSLSLVAKGASASYHHLSEFWRSKLDDQLGVRRMEMKFEEHLRLISDIESWDPLKTEATFEKSSP